MDNQDKQMSELLIELFSEEIHQTSNKRKKSIKKLFIEELSSMNLKYKNLLKFIPPHKTYYFVSGLPNTKRFYLLRLKDPKWEFSQNVVENFAKSKNINVENLFEKKLEKGTFYFIKTKRTRNSNRR